ncbi:MAG: DUF2752 domain-containing protein [Deltaproteobacteria bacterium]
MRADRILAAFSGLMLLASALVSAGNFPALIPCPFKMLTGMPCPGCGLTHALCNISHGNFVQAWMDNPLGFFFYALAVALLLWPLLETRIPRLNVILAKSRAAYWAPPLLVILMWAFDVMRIVRG